MGVFSFLHRKKKDDSEESFLPAEDSEDNSNIPEDIGFKPAFEERDQPVLFQSQQSSDSDMKLVLAKLELVNQRLEMIDRRLQVIEEIAKKQ